jgi:hypothetical protein
MASYVEQVLTSISDLIQFRKTFVEAQESSPARPNP